MSKEIIELNPLIYPTRIWVGFNLTDKEIGEKFYGLDENGYRIDISNDVARDDELKIATCSPVSDKVSGWRGVVMNIHRKKMVSAGVVAHEAEHIVCWICEQFGIDCVSFDDSEPRAYLMQWLVDEIWIILKQNKKK